MAKADAFIKEKFGGRNKFNVMRIKRALQEAVKDDAEYFAWINGEQTSARYNLATNVEKVSWVKGVKKYKYDEFDGADKVVTIKPIGQESTINIHLEKDGTILRANKGDWKGKKLDEVLGKGLADKIMEKESGTLSGEGLKFGGEWANNLYDKQVGNIVSDLTGAKVEKLDLGLPIDKKNVQWFVDKPNANATDLQNLSPNSLKVGQQVVKRYDQTAINRSEPYIITDILGDGKFKAVPKDITEYVPNGRGETRKVSLKDIKESDKQTFDISTKKTTQQGIRLTPEIKALVKGKSLLTN